MLLLHKPPGTLTILSIQPIYNLNWYFNTICSQRSTSALDQTIGRWKDTVLHKTRSSRKPSISSLWSNLFFFCSYCEFRPCKIFFLRRKGKNWKPTKWINCGMRKWMGNSTSQLNVLNAASSRFWFCPSMSSNENWEVGNLLFETFGDGHHTTLNAHKNTWGRWKLGTKEATFFYECKIKNSRTKKKKKILNDSYTYYTYINTYWMCNVE